MANNYDNYIFDLYGTLIDSDGDEKSAQNWKCWLRYLDKRGIKHPNYITMRKEFFELDFQYREDYKIKYGFNYPEIDVIDIYRFLFEKYGNGVLDDDLLYELSYAFRTATTAYIKLYDGVEEYLKKLRREGKKIFIMSNAQRSYTWPEIKMFGLDSLTDAQFISSDYKCMKPETKFYEALFEATGIQKEGSVMIGDSLSSDVEGAKKFGIDYIHLSEKYSANAYFILKLGE